MGTNSNPNKTKTTMALARHVDPDELVEKLRATGGPIHRHRVNHNSAASSLTPYSSRYNAQDQISKFRIPQEGAPADAVHQMLKDELDLDGRPNLNLASFVGTYMEREAEALMIENLSKNLSDADEYPAMMAMHQRCVSILAHLWGVQKGETAVGSAKWNFQLPRVKSINVSGHKFGLVYAGVGWIIWRDESYLPNHLKFELHYLGGTEESYTLNFSRPGAQIIAQYYNLIHLGFNGYRAIMENALANARLLSKALEATGWYTCVSDIHRKKGEFSFKGVSETVFGKENETSADYNAGLPVVAFRFSDSFKKDYPHIKQEAVSKLLRARQYIIPNYPLPPNEEKIEILRVVVRESMSMDLLDRLISDIVSVTQDLMGADEFDLASLQ